MKPYYEHADVTLYHGDCRDVLPLLIPASVALVVTDPPYGVAYSTGYRQSVARSSTQLHSDRDRMLAPLLNDTADALAPLLNNTAAMYWFAAPHMLGIVLPLLQARWQVPNVLAWDKGNCTAGDLETTYGKQWEAVVYARVQRAPLVGGRDRDVLRFSRGNTNDYHHPTQKPLPLLKYLLGRHVPGLVLDPFAGSGSTLVAAVQCGRPCVGVEIEEAHCEAAAKRLERVAQQPRLEVLA